MAIAYVNSAFSTSSTTAGTSKTISYTPTAGNTLIVFCFGVGVAATKVTDTKANLYQPYVPPTTSTVTATTFICRSCNGGATTITVTFASSTRNTVVVVEYSGALEVGKTNTATGSSTAPSVAITTQDNNNVVCAGMTTEGTSTWALSVGTALRNSQVGGGATTPGGGVIDNTSATPASTTETATLGTTGAWVAHAVELRTVVVPLLTDQNIDYYNQAALPPWRAGNLKLYAEDEQFSWGYLFDTKMSIDNERFDQPPKLISFVVPEIETEQFDWGYNVPLMGVGSTYMGYSGFWALKPAMGSEYEMFDYSSPEVITREDMYIDTWAVATFTEEDNEGEQFGFNPPAVIAVLPWDTEFNPPQQSSIIPEMETEQFDWSLNATELAGTGANLMGFRGFWSLRAAMGSDTEFDMVPLPGVAALPSMLYDFDYNPIQQLSQLFNDQSTEEFDWGYAVPLSGVGSQMMGYSGFWVSKPAMGSIDDWSFNPPAAPTAITPFDEDGVIPLAMLVRDAMEEIGMEPMFAIDADQQPLSVMVRAQQAEDEQVYPAAPFITAIPTDGVRDQWATAWRMLAQAEDEQVYPRPPFLTPIGFDDSPEQIAKPWVMFDDVETFGYSVSQEYPDADEQALPRTWMMIDDVDQPNFVETYAQDDQIQPLDVRRVVQEEEPMLLLVGAAPLPNMLYDYDFIPALGSLYFQCLDIESEQFSLNATELAGTGANLMGFRGFWSLRAAMGTDPEFDTSHSSFFALEQYGDVDEQSLSIVWMIADDVDQQNFVEVFVQDDQPQPLDVRRMAQEDEPMLLLVGVAPLPNMLYDADFNATMQLGQRFGLEDPDWGFNPPVTATYQEDSVYQDRPQLQSLTPEMETEQFDWGYAVPLAGVGSQMMGYSGFWVSKPAMGSEVDAWGFNPVAVVAAITPFTEEQNPVQFILQYQDVEDSAFNPIIVGTGGTQLMGFRGFRDYKAAMQPDEQWSFNAPVVTVTTAFDFDQQPLTATLVRDGVEEVYINPPFSAPVVFDPGDEFQPLAQPLAVQTEDEQVYPAPPFIVPIGFDDRIEHLPLATLIRDDVDQFGFNFVVPTPVTPFDFDQHVWQQRLAIQQVEDEQVYPAPPFLMPFPSDAAPEQVAKPWVMYDDVETFGYSVSQTFAEPQEFGPAQQRTFVPEIEDESAQVYPNPPFITAMPFDDSPEQLPNITVVMDIDHTLFVYGVLVGPLPSMPFDADFNPTMMRGFYFTSPEDEQFNWGYKPPTIATYQEDGVYQDRMMQSITPEMETEQFDWGFDRSRYYALGDEAPYFTSLWRMMPTLDDDTNWGFKPPAPVAISGFDQDELPPNKPQAITDDVMDSSYNPVIVGTGGTQMMGFRGYKSPQAAMGEDAWGYNVIPPLPNMLYDAEFNPAQQASFFFKNLDTEEFDWGYKPPTLSTYQEDVGADQWPRFLWNLDWVEGYEAQPPLTTVVRVVPIVYKVENEALLDLIVSSHPFFYVATAQGQLALNVKAISGVPGILVGPVSSTGIISVQGITVQ